VRFGEVFLRLGCSLVAWMMLYTYIVWLAALHVMACGPDGDEMHRLLLGLAPFACGFAFMLRMTRPFPEVHRMLSWLGIPIALLALFAVANIWTVFMRVSLDAISICSEQAATFWQLIWAPTQFAALLVIALLVFGNWRSARLRTPGVGVKNDSVPRQ
jgi:hypothetical protein